MDTGKCSYKDCTSDAREPWSPIIIGCGCGCGGIPEHGGGEIHLYTTEEYCNLHAFLDHLETPKA